jgi:hypothetical protein
LGLVHQLCTKQIHVTKRDLFYTDVKLFEVSRAGWWWWCSGGGALMVVVLWWWCPGWLLLIAGPAAV